MFRRIAAPRRAERSSNRSGRPDRLIPTGHTGSGVARTANRLRRSRPLLRRRGRTSSRTPGADYLAREKSVAAMPYRFQVK